MDVNHAELEGTLALPPDVELLPDGTERARLLLCVRSDHRIDVVPVVVPGEVGGPAIGELPGGSRLAVSGALMRFCSPYFWEPSGRIEVIARFIRLIDGDERRQSR